MNQIIRKMFKETVQQPTGLILTAALVFAAGGVFVDMTNAFGMTAEEQKEAGIENFVNGQVSQLNMTLGMFYGVNEFSYDQTSHVVTANSTSTDIQEDDAGDIVAMNGFNMTAFVPYENGTTIVAQSNLLATGANQ